MKTKGSITHIGVSLKELNRIYKEDAVIPVSKKALNAYLMAAGLDEASKTISLNVVDNTQKTETKPEPEPEVELGGYGPGELGAGRHPNDIGVPESNPPIELNVSNGDW